MTETLWFNAILLLVSFGLLIKGGDWFVDGAVGVAHRFKLPELLIGATVVSIGTTLPEVMVSAGAAIESNSGISYGNAIGSIICNTSLISAITIAFAPNFVDKRQLRTPVIFFFASSALYCICAIVFGRFYRWVGILLVLIFLVYMFITVRQAMRNPEIGEQEVQPQQTASAGKDILLLVVGAAVIAVGAKFLINSATYIAQYFKVPDSVIGLTIVALGTSLPEFITAIISLIKKHANLSLGNIIGANLFNIILVSGVAITINPFELPAEKQIFNINASYLIDIPVFLIVMLLLVLPPLIKGKTYRFQGIILLMIYAAYTIFQFAF